MGHRHNAIGLRGIPIDRYLIEAQPCAVPPSELSTGFAQLRSVVSKSLNKSSGLIARDAMGPY
jgi:hypothetical protein